MSELRELEIAAPESGCDRLWARAVITRVSGERMRATIPVRYVGDYESQSTNLLLGRETCWHPVGEERLNLYSGEGQRMWATEFSEYALLDVRAIRLRGKSA
ncbi:ImpE protein [compost metagenome]